MSRDRWALALEARARAHWTDARTDALLRGKDVPVRPRDAAVLLRAMGLLDEDAAMPPARVHKFFQINHAVAILGRAIADLRARHPVVRVVDAGCGRSYLTMLLAWCGAHVWAHRIEVLGVDRNPDVVAEGARRAAMAGLEDRVRFAAAALGGFDARAAFGGADVHGVVALHACDTATCDAIVLGVETRAPLIAVAPCCQAELARGWARRAEAPDDGTHARAFAPAWGAPHLRRELAAHTTDLLRVLLLRAAGYRVTALELVPDEHTRKNTLLRAQRPADAEAGADGDPEPARIETARAAAEYRALVDATGGVGLALAARLGLG